jgi:23S rRNA (guanine745-N1)-methyltransferase
VNIKQAADAFEAAVPMLRCPLCREPISLIRPGSLVCGNGHCYDLSSRGYAGFLSGKSMGGGIYDKDLFVSRARVMRGGYYNQLESELCSQLLGVGGVLDAGCGEGFLTAAVSRGTGSMVIGLDNCTQAVRLAALQDCAAVWLAADLANIPLKDESVAAVANILAPANYSEFSRVLSTGGKIIKVIPGNDYLCQLRRCAAGMLHHSDYDSRVVTDYFARNTYMTGTRTIYATLPLTTGMQDAFVRMTPMLSGIPAAEIRCPDLTEITIHLEVLTGEKRP